MKIRIHYEDVGPEVCFRYKASVVWGFLHRRDTCVYAATSFADAKKWLLVTLAEERGKKQKVHSVPVDEVVEV